MPEGLTPEKEIARLKYLITQKVHWALDIPQQIAARIRALPSGGL